MRSLDDSDMIIAEEGVTVEKPLFFEQQSRIEPAIDSMLDISSFQFTHIIKQEQSPTDERYNDVSLNGSYLRQYPNLFLL